jgi:hypothetical protein
LSSITWSDVDGSVNITAGDELVFTFSEEMDTTTLEIVPDINSRLDSTASGTTDYGTTFSFSWNTAKTELTVTLGAGKAIVGGETVNPASDVKSAAGLADATLAPDPAIPTTPGSIPTPSPTPAKWQDEPYDENLPHYTYDYVMFVEQLERGAPASTFNITVGINWMGNTPRVVPTVMTAIFICPDDGFYHMNIAFFPKTFTLEIGQTQTVTCAIGAKEEAGLNNYIIQIEAHDSDSGTPRIQSFIPNIEGWCRVNPSVLGEGCFIATAAYGTSTAKELDVLRSFRDEVLLKSTLGSQFVELYYQTSPPVADFISGNSLLRTLVRELLVDPVASLVKATEAIWRD